MTKVMGARGMPGHSELTGDYHIACHIVGAPHEDR